MTDPGFNTVHYSVGPDRKIVVKLCNFYAQFLVVIGGHYETNILGHHITAGTGDVLYFAPHTPHTDWNSTIPRLKYYVTPFIWKTEPTHLPNMVHDTEGRLRTMVEWLSATGSIDPQNRQFFCDNCFGTFVAEYIRLSEPQIPAMVQDTRNFMSEHMNEKISLPRLAKHVNLDRSYFAKRYKSLTGKSPFQDLRAMRLRTAQHLLVTTNYPLKEIAPRVGFSCEAALCHALRKHANTSATEIRKN